MNIEQQRKARQEGIMFGFPDNVIDFLEDFNVTQTKDGDTIYVGFFCFRQIGDTNYFFREPDHRYKEISMVGEVIKTLK